jgi:hypothetical protein
MKMKLNLRVYVQNSDVQGPAWAQLDQAQALQNIEPGPGRRLRLGSGLAQAGRGLVEW